jgi:Flp pilus assembly protein CpaB
VLTRLASLPRRARRRVLAHRRLLAFALTAAAVATGLQAARPAPPVTVALTVAARDLPAGVTLTGRDLATVRVRPGDVPADARRHPVGETLAAPLRRGEPITGVRLVGPSLTQGHPELTAVPVRFPDAAMAALLRVGDRVDLYVTDPSSGHTEPVTDDALVLGLPDPSPAGSGPSGDTVGLQGRLVVVGVAAGSVETVASASVGGFLTFAY